MYGFDHGGWMLGGGLMMLIWMLLGVGLVVALALYLVKPSGGRSASDQSALEILMERYARGEIGKDEYAQKKLDISS